MNVNIRYKGFEGSDAVKLYVEERSQKLGKFLPPTTTLNATLADTKVVKSAEINFHFNGDDYVAKNESESLMTAIDESFDTLTRQLSRAKDKRQTSVGRKPDKLDKMEEPTL